jgi:two-component SAPR family response regulator
VILPEMNGRELAEQIRAVHPGIKVLFMSGYTANVIAHHGVLEKTAQFVSKPFTREKLAVKVRQALEGEMF